MDTLVLVNRSKAGDKEALIQLIMKKKQEYYKLAYVYTGSKEDALDALQDMVVIMYENIKKLKKPESFYSWSKTILVNCCKKIIRQKKRVVLLNNIREKEDIQKHQEERQDILNTIKKLNKGQQEAIVLKYFFDMDYQTISEITKTPLGTVKSRLSTGLARLKELLGGEY